MVCILWCTGIKDKLNVNKTNWIVFSEVVSFALQRSFAFTFELDPLYDKKGGLDPPSKDNSAPLHYSLYAQLMGFFFILSS